MPYPTRGEVKKQYQSLLDDYPQTATSPYNENVFAPAFEEAYDALYGALLNAQGARIELMQSFPIPAYTTELTPADLGINNMGEPIFLRERLLGSNEKLKELHMVDVLPQRQPGPYLFDVNWRNNTFYFVGATNLIDLQIKWEASSQAPVDDATEIQIDNCKNFLANYAVGVSGGRKGDEATAARCMNLAVGPKWNQGVAGGYLLMLIQPSVRNRQNVQIAHRPYTTWGRPYSRWGNIPYVAAQQGTTGGGANNVPIQFSSATGGIIGPIDTVNRRFWVNAGNVVTMIVMVNGVTQTVGTDYSFVGNQFEFTPIRTPRPGDIITAEVYVANPVNYGSAPVSQPPQYVPATGPGSVDG